MGLDPERDSRVRMSETLGDHMHRHVGQQEVRGMNNAADRGVVPREARAPGEILALCARMVFAMNAGMLWGD